MQTYAAAAVTNVQQPTAVTHRGHLKMHYYVYIYSSTKTNRKVNALKAIYRNSALSVFFSQKRRVQ